MVPVIEVDRLTRKFGDFTAVDSLNFSVHRNEIFGLLGPNGAGKTTTISMICGLLQPTDGTVRFPGSEGKHPKLLIGYCPQENIFYPRLTCLEQLVFIANMYGIATSGAVKRAAYLLELLGLSEKMNLKASGLSGGMKRRLNICLALMHEPEILILDEPEAGLDPQSRILVREFIRNMGKKKTVILTTHNMDEADRLAQRIAIMDYGKLLMIDTPDCLKKSVGDGDMLEVVLSKNEGSLIRQFTDKATVFAELIASDTNHIIFRHKKMIDVLPDLKKLANDCDLKISEFKLRENSLEDVFIHLTGRNLRQ